MNLCNLKTSWAIAGLLLLFAARPAHPEPAAAPPVAHAEDACTSDEQCDHHYRSAQELRRAGRLEQALAEYQAAYRLQPIATLLYNIARLNHKLNRVNESIDCYQSYLLLEAGTLPELRRKVREYLAELQPSIPKGALPAQVGSPAGLGSERAKLTGSSTPSPRIAEVRPVYKRWWFWSLVGSMAATGAVAGAVLGTWPRTPDSAERLSLSFP